MDSFMIALGQNVAANGRWFVGLIIAIALYRYSGESWGNWAILAALASLGAAYLSDGLRVAAGLTSRVATVFAAVSFVAGAASFVCVALLLMR